MQVTETSADGLRREYRVVVAAADIEQRIEARLDDLGSRVKLPGFRPGKIPRKVLRQRYGKAVLGEVLEGAVNETSRDTMSERGIRPATQPKIEITKFDDGTDLEYTMAVEMLPEIEPIDFAGMSLTRLRAPVTDTVVGDALGRLAESRKSFAKVAKARPAKAGDQVLIDFSGSVDGDKLPEMQGQDMEVELGSGMLIPGFEDQLVGKGEGAFSIDVDFPDDYPSADVAGKKAVFEIVLKEVRENQPVSIDEDLAKQVGFEDLEGLKGAVRRQTENEYDRVSRARLKRELLDSLAERHTFAVPVGMIDSEFDSIWQQVEEARGHGHDHDHDHDHDHGHPKLDDEDAGKSDEELKAEYRGIAERRVRLGLILSDVARLNNLAVTQEELNRAMIEEARRHPGQEQQVVEFFRKNPQAIDSLRAPILEDKVVDYILEIAKVDEKDVTSEELMRDPDEAPAKAAGSAEGGKKRAPAKKKEAGKAPAKTAKKPAAKKN